MIAFHTNIDRIDYPLVAIDLGYSNKKPSCGIMHTGANEPQLLTFGSSIKEVKRLVQRHRTLILVVEAVLSTYHDEYGNPDIRGAFEKGRGWYHGPGVATYAAAIRLLKILRQDFTNRGRRIINEQKSHSNH